MSTTRRRRAAVGIGACLAALHLGGCRMPLHHSVPEARLVATGEHEVLTDLHVPEVRGVAGCGAQALAAAIAYTARAGEGDVEALAAVLPWHHEGATPVDLLLEARRRGFEARIARGTWKALGSAFDAKRAVLVMLDAAPEVRTLTGGIPTPRVMHWAIVSGLADDGSAVLLGAPHDRHHVLPRKILMQRWERSDFCMITVSDASEPAR